MTPNQAPPKKEVSRKAPNGGASVSERRISTLERSHPQGAWGRRRRPLPGRAWAGAPLPRGRRRASTHACPAPPGRSADGLLGAGGRTDRGRERAAEAGEAAEPARVRAGRAPPAVPRLRPSPWKPRAWPLDQARPGPRGPGEAAAAHRDAAPVLCRRRRPRRRPFPPPPLCTAPRGVGLRRREAGGSNARCRAAVCASARAPGPRRSCPTPRGPARGPSSTERGAPLLVLFPASPPVLNKAKWQNTRPVPTSVRGTECEASEEG